MLRSKRRFAVLGLCAVALGAVVFGSSAVQAEKGANWMVNGANINGTLLPEVQIKEVVMSDMTLVGSSKNGTKLEILCTSAKFSNTKLGSEGTIASGSVTKFSGCSTKLNGVLSKPCEPHNGAEKGVIVSRPLKGLLILSEKEAMIEFTPVEGTLFVTITLGEECTIEGELPVSGTSIVRDKNKALATESVTHTVEQAGTSKLTLCGNPATISGAATLELTGAAHVGLKWSGLPA